MSTADLSLLIAVPGLLALTVAAVVFISGWLDRHPGRGRGKR